MHTIDCDKPNPIAGLEQKWLGASVIVGFDPRSADKMPPTRGFNRIDPGLSSSDSD